MAESAAPGEQAAALRAALQALSAHQLHVVVADSPAAAAPAGLRTLPFAEIVRGEDGAESAQRKIEELFRSLVEGGLEGGGEEGEEGGMVFVSY